MDYQTLFNFFQPQFVISLIISFVLSLLFILWQWKEYKTNIKAINKLKLFFAKKENYSTYEAQEYSAENEGFRTVVTLKDVAIEGAELKHLIKDINAYINKSKGTVAFSIIQNKTERRITMLYEIATSKLSFPTHIGLMGTFAGVFVGLIMFLVGTFFTQGITDVTIQSLISGVLVSMITSFCGIWMLISSHRAASNASNKIDKDKNEFYEWVQNELMPTVDVSMVEAIGKLHETIDHFEPSFTSIISQFKEAFKDVTQAFGDEFRSSVNIIKDAVELMGKNIDKINNNIDLQNELLKTIRSRELIHGMESFVEASKRFNNITDSLDQFERARRLMLVAAQESINLQRSYNDSLQVPRQVASEINSILNRITTFESNIEGLGVSISQTQLVGNELVEQIKDNITAIKSKQKVAEKMADTANQKLEHYFEGQQKDLAQFAEKYHEALESYLNNYDKMLQERKAELEVRKNEFAEAIDKKFSLEDIRNEFTSLRKLKEISDKLDQLISSGTKSTDIILELKKIEEALNASKSKEHKGIFGIKESTSEPKKEGAYFTKEELAEMHRKNKVGNHSESNNETTKIEQQITPEDEEIKVHKNWWRFWKSSSKKK